MAGRISVESLLNALGRAVVAVDDSDTIIASSVVADRFVGLGESLVGKCFSELVIKALCPRVKDPKRLMDWLEIIRAGFAFGVSAPSDGFSCEIQYKGDDGERTLIAYAAPFETGNDKPGVLYSVHDFTELRQAERVLEAISEAARQVNSDLQVKEMLPNLFEAVRQRVKLDGMAILLLKDVGRTEVLGSLPENLMGGPGAGVPVQSPSDTSGILIDIVSDIDRALDSDEAAGTRPLLSRKFLEELKNDGYRSMTALPLSVPGQVVGIWVLASKEPRSYAHADMAFLEPVAGHLASAVKNATLLETTKEMYSAAVRALAATVDIRDSYTMHHSEHVAMVARRIAEEMGLPPDEVEVIELAGLVHDIGKIGIPDSILQKPGPLGPAERSIMTHHSVLGASILERAGMLADLAPLVLHHHEWHNGAGYPDGLHGGEIPLGAAILSVADALDTMISDRTYRPGMSLDEAMRELQRCAGAQFQPEVVDALSSVLKRASANDERWLAQLIGDNAAEIRKMTGYEPRTLAEQSMDVEQASFSTELEILFKVAQETRRLLALPEILEKVCCMVSQDMGFSSCAVLVPDHSGEALEIIAGTGDLRNATGHRVPLGHGVAWWVMANGIPQSVPDATLDDRHLAGVPGVGSEFHLPLDIRGRRLGVFVIQRAEKGSLRPTDMRVLMAVAGHIASALEVAQLHDRVKQASESGLLPIK